MLFWLFACVSFRKSITSVSALQYLRNEGANSAPKSQLLINMLNTYVNNIHRTSMFMSSNL